MKKIALVSATLVLAFALAGCGSSASSSSAASSTASSSTAMSATDIKSSSSAAASSSGAQQTQAAVQPKTDDDGPNFDVAAVVEANGLGQLTHYFWVQGADGQDYWGICAIGDDGVEHVTYTDAYGSVIQGGDVPTASGVVPDGPTKTN